MTSDLTRIVRTLAIATSAALVTGSVVVVACALLGVHVELNLSW